MYKPEMIFGIIIAVIGFLAYLGYDIVSIIILSALGGFVYFLMVKRGLIKNVSFSFNSGYQPINFNDIGGQNPAKQEIQEALDFINQFDKYQSMGIRHLKGILLTVPP